GDFMCKDCHSPRNVGRYVDNTSANRGSHPVGLAYPGSGNYETTPTGSVTIVGGNVECSSCHQTHYATTTDGNLLRQTNDDALCTSCHTLFNSAGTPTGTHNGMSCHDCHQTHNNNKANLYMIKNTVSTPSSGDKTVVFTALTGSGNFADGDGVDGICEVCHTTTDHFRNSDNLTGVPDQLHTNLGADISDQNCMTCHPHNANFEPQGCTDCHIIAFPDWGTTDNHAAHVERYNYSCSTCHLNYGSGGSSELLHPSSTLNSDSTMNTLVRANVNIDLSGLATRNGQDVLLAEYVAPAYDDATYTCTNMYCHSNGRSAYRGTNGGPELYDTWSSDIGYQDDLVYRSIPAWNTSTDVSCGADPISGFTCHEGPAVVETVPDYLINDVDHPLNMETSNAAKDYYPSTGSHGPNRGAHASNSQNLQSGAVPDGTEWGAVQCFWCHDTDGNDANGPKYQGTYGTSWHADGETYFVDARWVSNGGSMVNPITYSFEGAATHCGQSSNSCW
ncbi:MAG: hypothetical protein KAS29_18630, partial [Bacteroidales bacterium]|nr:hypothetical protein [Bacteroidales bacterium]